MGGCPYFAVRARMVRLAWRYPWSSAAAHAGEPDATGVLDLASWRRMYSPAEWRRILQRVEDVTIDGRLQSSLRTGRPLASDRWLAKLEAKLNRRLRPMPVGRPRKKMNRTPLVRGK